MPAERLSMRKVREVLRLKHACGASVRTIARSVGVGHTTVAEYLRRTGVIGITWPVPAEIDDAELERRLFAPAGFYKAPTRAMPDWNHVHAELRRRGVTLLLLWEEYRAEHGDGYGYSRFCDLYIDWRRGVSATMRQTHVAGEKLFVDYAGDTVAVFDGATGEERRAHVFVAVLGASNYTYAEARWSEGLADWIGAHVNALAFLGGVPKLLVCDNLRAGVTAACRYEPGINRTYQEMAAHYSSAVLPTRIRRPRDKAKVEVAVLIVQRWILARLRNQRFFALAELNLAIRALVEELNARLMRKLSASRREFFDSIDRPALMPLPAEPYQYAEWRRARVARFEHQQTRVIRLFKFLNDLLARRKRIMCDENQVGITRRQSFGWSRRFRRRFRRGSGRRRCRSDGRGGMGIRRFGFQRAARIRREGRQRGGRCGCRALTCNERDDYQHAQEYSLKHFLCSF